MIPSAVASMTMDSCISISNLRLVKRSATKSIQGSNSSCRAG